MSTSTVTAQRRRKRTKTVNPTVAWPTLLLLGVTLSVWASMVTASLMDWVSLWVSVPVLAVASYVLFTPMHDSTHKSVARRGWVNEVVGRVCAFVLAAPFPAFRWAHLRHHKKTNDHHEDPDAWSGGGRWWTLPLRWLTQDLYYYVFYVQRWSTRPVKERVETVGTVLLIAGTAVALTAAGFGWEVLLLWLVPARLAVGMLALFFDFVPHHPHAVTAAEDRYRATSNTRGIWWTPVLLYQNYHLLHHLYPGVPFYRYGQVWREREATLVAKGAQTLGFLERFQGEEEPGAHREHGRHPEQVLS